LAIWHMQNAFFQDFTWHSMPAANCLAHKVTEEILTAGLALTGSTRSLGSLHFSDLDNN
jgi:hypothetical protein